MTESSEDPQRSREVSDKESIQEFISSHDDFQELLTSLNRPNQYGLEIVGTLEGIGRRELIGERDEEYDHFTDYYAVGLWRIAWEQSKK